KISTCKVTLSAPIARHLFYILLSLICLGRQHFNFLSTILHSIIPNMFSSVTFVRRHPQDVAKYGKPLYGFRLFSWWEGHICLRFNDLFGLNQPHSVISLRIFEFYLTKGKQKNKKLV